MSCGSCRRGNPQEDPRFRIESAYGTSDQNSWAYNVIRTSDGVVILEGEVEKLQDGRYYPSIEAPEEECSELGSMTTPMFADTTLLSTLKSRASALLDEGDSE
jgi:hypothetical protein